MAERYNFKYLPLVGKLPGKSMVEQTETAINELASVVYDNVGHVGNLAEEVQTANTNASNALDKATEALETSSRVYIKQIAAVDVNDYYDSELYYINNDGSTNIPVRDRGFLEVKTNDDKTACEQVFIADSTGTPYYRHGRITKQTLGEETTYVVTWGSWYRVATTEYVQAELQDYLPLSGGTVTGDLTVTGTLDGTASGNLPLSGGSITGDVDITGDLSVSGAITGNVTGNLTGNADTATNATNATNDANGNPIAGTYLPLAGGTMTGSINYVENGKVFSIGNTDPGNVDLGWNWANSEGAGIGLRSADHLKTPGEFSLYARDSANSCSLEGKPDGSLTWDSKEVERVVSKSNNYIRYDSGIQICWGGTNNITTSGTYTITFPVAFANSAANINIAIGRWWAASSTEEYYLKDMSATSVKLTTTGNVGDGAHRYLYIAIGLWK